MKSVSISAIKDAVKKLVFGEVKNVAKYVDGQKTNDFEGVSIKCFAKDIGEIQIILPYQANLVDEIKQRYSFASVFDIDEFGSIQDIKISIFKENLNIKLFVS